MTDENDDTTDDTVEDPLTNADPTLETVKVTMPNKVCKACGTMWFAGDIACPTCGTKDYWDYDTNVPETESHGEADDMIWTPSEVKPKSEQFNTTEEVNDLTDDNTETDPVTEPDTSELDTLRTELEEAKSELGTLKEEKATREEAELNALKAKVNELISDEQKETYKVEDKTIAQLNEFVTAWALHPTKPETKNNSVRGSTGTGNKDAEAEVVEAILKRNKQ